MKDYVINFKNLNNARSLSYLVNKNGQRIKNNLLLRSGNLASLEEDECLALASTYHLSKVIDLRTSKESKIKPDKKVPNCEIVLCPILPSAKIGITKEEEDEPPFEVFIETLQKEGLPASEAYMENTYEFLFNSNFALAGYERFLNEVLTSEGPVLWHCSAGKDRAGFATILVLYILDFDFDVIKSDYLLTNSFYEETIKNNLNHFGKEYEGILRCVFGVKEEYFTTILTKINNIYGSFGEFIVNGLHFSKEKQYRMKEKYLEV